MLPAVERRSGEKRRAQKGAECVWTEHRTWWGRQTKGTTYLNVDTIISVKLNPHERTPLCVDEKLFRVAVVDFTAERMDSTKSS